MTPEQSTILLIILFALVIALVTWVIRLELRIKKLLTGTNKTNLEQGILDIKNQHETYAQFRSTVEAKLKQLDTRMSTAVRGVNTIRFDASTGGGTGGNQSFATALIDEKGDGVVVSTLQTRERVGVFSKPLKNGTSEYELTEEESRAVETARQNLNS